MEGERVPLSKKEFALLRALAAAPTRVFTREELLREVWGFRSLGATRTLDSHASRLRRKLAVGRAVFIINVWGVGYRLLDGGRRRERRRRARGVDRGGGHRGDDDRLRRMVGSRMEAVARACHELRGPLTAARLGLSLGSGAASCRPTGCGRSTPSSGGRRWPFRISRTSVAGGGAASESGSSSGSTWRAPGRLRASRRWAGRRAGHPVAAVVGWSAGVGVGRPPAVRAGAGQPDRQRDRARGRGVEVRGVVGESVVRIEVSDDGPGLPSRSRELTRGARRGRGARGRGLAIAAVIVETHGGRLITAPAQRGARVVCELPLAPTGPAARAAG